ncbi:glycosyl transferase [Leptospira sarikeiensis]|uniref:Glycosyl transferase n=1 Tax=Leptospira sarikeiensis TaxID=2484943 RepID=A0A4R9KBU9_9LEPT|nr:glycosyl transferase [Leptospira sarikeiensis]TGL64227.1 glycosyl transferase [Leptospira sarikeiensis]
MKKVKISAFVSGHGFGHISRSLEAITKLLYQNPEWSATIHSPRGEEFASSLDMNGIWGTVKTKVQFRKTKTDVGIVQKDSLGMDLDSTEKEIIEFKKKVTDLFGSECDFIKKEKPDLIWSDSGSLPFQISSDLKIPSLFLGNFTWDYIYSHYDSLIFQEYSKELKKEYSLCDLGLILPLSCPVTSILKKKEIGLLGRKPNLSKEEARKYYGFEEGIEYYLFSFGAYGIDSSQFDWKYWDPSKRRIVIGGIEWKIESKNNLGIVTIPNCHYPDLLSACDFVLTKPGYGILSEAYFAETPILYTDRGNFPEYPYLVEALKSQYKSSYISHEELFNFQWTEASSTAKFANPKNDPRFQKDSTQDILDSIKEILS